MLPLFQLLTTTLAKALIQIAKMIRQANKYDKDTIKELLRQFRDEAPIQEFKQFENVQWIDSLIDCILAGSGIIYIDDQKRGMIIGLITPVIWDNTTFQMNELAWYVKPQSRHTTIGYRLLKSYIAHGEQLQKAGRIKTFTLAKLTNSPNIKYEKYGFRKLDEIWVR